MTKTILTCAVTGNITRPDQTPYLPITPQQIADDSIAAYRAGASIVHIHVRDPETGAPSMAVDHYREAVERIRDVTDDLILNLTTGPGQRFLPGLDDPSVAAPGTNLLKPADRVPHVLDLKPEICTLDLNTMASGDQVVINIPRTVREMASLVRGAGVKPELELFSSGDAIMATDLMKEVDFSSPLMVSFVMGIKYGWPATVEALQLALSLLPPETIWTAFGVGRFSFRMVAQSVLLGGHIRVGLEDNLYLSKGELAKGNGPLCEKAVRIVRDLGSEIASPGEARKMLGLA